ncbi:uncharacterized protein LOC143907153 isoform X1 [Temnothorax americanus]|uniref:uncharacterized protein LOC143907153 isoform X1 n=1 Tax=Temnothorax americanus TaxID=1964332 RepID=UPI004068C8B2
MKRRKRMSASRLTRDNKPNRSPLRKSQENSSAGRKLVISDFTCCFSHRSHAPGNLYLTEGYLPAVISSKNARLLQLHSHRAQQRLVLAIVGLAMPIYCEETQVEKKQEKRGVLGLGYGGYGGLGNALIAGPAYGGYGQSYLGGVAPAYSSGHGHGISAPAYGYSVPVASHGYASAPLYRIGYSGGLGHGGASLGGLGHGGVAAVGGPAYGIGSGYGARGLGAGIGYGAGAGLGYGAGLGHGLGAGLGAGYGHGL